jgi:hypothetical protein
MCFSRSLAVAASPRTWGGAAADARAQSSRSCARSSADLRAARGHTHRQTRALEARGGSRMARDNPAADGNRGGASASRPARCALANDRGALCRSQIEICQPLPGPGRLKRALCLFTGRSWWSALPSPIERIQTAGRPNPYSQIRMRLVPAANALGAQVTR